MPVDEPPHTIEPAIEAVLAYLWDHESADYAARSMQEKRGHIFAELKTLQAWLLTPKKMLDKFYHTVAPQCLQLLQFETEGVIPSAFATFTKCLCAFALELRPLERSVRVTTYVANHRGVA